MKISNHQHSLMEIEKAFNTAKTLDEKALAIHNLNTTFATAFRQNDNTFIEPLLTILKRISSVYVLEENIFKNQGNYAEYSKLFQFTISYWNDISNWLVVKDTYKYPTFRMNIESIRYYEDNVLIYNDSIQKYRQYISHLMKHDKKIINEFENNPITQRYLAEAKAKQQELVQQAILQTSFKN